MTTRECSSAQGQAAYLDPARGSENDPETNRSACKEHQIYSCLGLHSILPISHSFLPSKKYTSLGSIMQDDPLIIP